jgi:hypothetical protein
MSSYADNPAGFLHLSRRLLAKRTRAFQRATTVANCLLLVPDMPTRLSLRLCSTSTARAQMRTLLWRRVCRLRVPPLFGHRVGAFHAPCGNSLFCFGCAALWVTVSLQILFGKSTRKDFSGASVNAELRHLGAWPTRTTGAPTKIGRFHKRRQSCTRTK